jgi:hypothetical protein
VRVRWFLSSRKEILAAQGHRASVSDVLEWVLESRSGGEPHHVRCRNGSWSCSCKAYTKGSKDCWAIKETRASLTPVN